MRSGGLLGLGLLLCQHLVQPAYGVSLLTGKQVSVRIHRQRDTTMTHHCLDHLGVFKPPLAIGVFGEWGSGKSFFMSLLERHVRVLAEEASLENNDDLFHADIVHIRFNAWHYMETNLWASLVDFIFKELDRWLSAKPESTDKVDELFANFNTVRQLQLESAQDLINAKSAEVFLAKQFETARTNYETKMNERRNLTAKIVKAAVKTALSGQEKQIQKAAANTGLIELKANVDELSKQVQQMHDTGRPTGLLLRSMMTVLGRTGMVVVLFVLLVLVPGALLGLTRFVEGDSAAWIRTLTGSFSYYVIAISGVLSYLIPVAARSQATLQRFYDELQRAIQQETTNEQEAVNKAEEELAKRRKILESAEQHFRESFKRVEQAREELRGATPRVQLNRFIRAKVVEGDYAKHLGIIASIRSDFAQLAQLMADEVEAPQAKAEQERSTRAYEKAAERLIENAHVDLQKELRTFLLAAAKPEQEDLKSFKRIILYIDDLDRCPPGKVVDVLQAIHLLLCFPLFVVVVAVDARWVSRALNREFPDLLEEGVIVENGQEVAKTSRGATSGDRDRRRGASSQDYLEKIFQIPYWVRPMEERAAKRYVRWLVRKDRLPEETVKPQKIGPVQPAVGPKLNTDLRTPASTDPKPLLTPDEQEEDKPLVDEKKDDVLVEETQRRHVVESLRLSEYEEDFLSRLAPFAGGSPRRGLRFVNSYRLVKTSLKVHQLEGFVGDEGKQLGYRAIITQLAITTGSPHVAQYYFQTIDKNPAADLSQLVKTLKQDQRINSLDEEWQNLKGALETLAEQNRADGVDTGQEMVKTLKAYAPIARRYSFTARPR